MRKTDIGGGRSASQCDSHSGRRKVNHFWFLTDVQPPLQMALFAGALVSLAQIVSAADQNMDTTSVSWGALRVFLYSAIMLNLGGAFMSLITIKMCSDLPLAAQQTLLREGHAGSSHPLSKIARGETIDTNDLKNHFRLLRAMGMSPWYQRVDGLSTWMLIIACVCTFAALTFWVFLSGTIATAGVTMVIFGPVAIIIVIAFVYASQGQGWQ